MHVGLDNIIKLKFTTNFDRYAILNVLKCFTKNFSRYELIDNRKLVRKQWRKQPLILFPIYELLYM